MDDRLVVGGAAIAVLIVLRVFATRRVAAHEGQYVWLLFLPTLLFGVASMYISLEVFSTDPLLGILMAVGDVTYLAVLVRFILGFSRAVTSTSSPDELASAITEPMVDYMSTLVGLGLIGGLVAVVGLIVWGVIRASG